ncbi:MAG: hypothetical protein K2X91_07550, partial [Thermoleophilia bacterium]|nr:hypothetical protein [Thermoleophilia bacterium]
RAEQAASQTRAQADSWLEALRAGTGVGGSADDAARRADVAILDTVERLLTSQADASSNRSIFDFVATVLPQARFREGDPGRDRVLTWFADQRLTPADLRLITGSVATQSAASGIEPTMVLAAGATQADRDDLRARYAEAWSKAGNAASRASGGANADWHQAARAAMTAAGQATGDLEQLGAAANLARLSEVASLRFRGLPGQLPTGDAVPAAAAPSPFRVNIATAGPGAGADGEWARRYLAESRTAAARMGRIAEFEQMASPGQVDCEVLADAALTSTGETRAAAQRAVLKRAEDPNMVNAVLEALPRTRKSAGAGEFLGQFSQAGALPVTSDRWYFHFRKALVERLLTLLAFSNATVAADRVSAALAEAWNTVAGGPAGDVPEVDGPTESVAAAVRAFSALTTQVRQQVPGPTALINPDALERSHAGRVLVARGLPQAFAANQVSAVEA